MADLAPVFEAAAPPAPTPVPAEPPAESWSSARRLAFRFVFCFAVLLYFPHPLGLVPFSDKVTERIDQAHVKAAIWVADRLFHPPPEELPEQTGSGDTLWNWTQTGALLVLALVAAAVWTALDRRRAQYRTLSAWLDLSLRWALFQIMLGYGFAKVFPHQMPWETGRLVEPLGEMSPMGLVWTFMGFAPAYEALAGWAEVIAGLLLVWRRTAGVGALLLLGVMGNVMAINFFYDVPVKLYSAQLWLTGLFVVAPDLRRLFRLLVLQRPTEPAPPPPPLVRWRWVRQRRWLGPALAVLLAGWQVFDNVKGGVEFEGELKEWASQSPIAGPWQVESFTPSPSAAPDHFLANPAWVRVSGSILSAGVLRADGSYLTFRTAAGEKGEVKLTRSRTTLKQTATVRIEHPDPEHTRIFGEGFEVKLKAIPKSSFTLLRGFHWVQANPINR
jgi:hypothetical protein